MLSSLVLTLFALTVVIVHVVRLFPAALATLLLLLTPVVLLPKCLTLSLIALNTLIGPTWLLSRRISARKRRNARRLGCNGSIDMVANYGNDW